MFANHNESGEMYGRAANTCCVEQNMQIEAQIKQYVSENLLFSDNGYPYDNDASFLRAGIIDSMGVMELVTYVGTNFGIQIEPQEIIPDNFDSVTKLAGFIRRKQSPSAGQASSANA